MAPGAVVLALEGSEVRSLPSKPGGSCTSAILGGYLPCFHGFSFSILTRILERLRAKQKEKTASKRDQIVTERELDTEVVAYR